MSRQADRQGAPDVPRRFALTIGRLRPSARKTAYTLLLLPHAEGRFRKVHFSRGFAVTLLVVGLAVVAGSLWSPHLWLLSRTQASEMDRLAGERASLLDERSRFEDALMRIAGQLEQYEEHADRLAMELGLEDLRLAQPAAGGPGDSDFGGMGRGVPYGEELGALNGRTARLQEGMSEIDGAFRQRMRVLDATPSRMPAAGWFSDGYGWRKDPFSGKRVFHRGLDIVADHGSGVVATADGTVAKARRNGGYGNTIEVSHDVGYVTRYSHLSEMLVSPGQPVKRGDIIGKVGNTGRSTGPHLHYEVIRDGRRVNPWKYLGRKRG